MTHWLLWILLLLMPSTADAARAKDIGFFFGKSGNTVSGAGLVTGLPRSGDSMRNEAAIRALATRLQGYGVTFSERELASRNIAMVMVTATIPPDARAGSLIDLKVSSTGDALSIEGGQLLTTPLFGLDGRIHVIGTGPVLVGGYASASAGNFARKGVPTSGQVLAGGRVQLEVEGPDMNGKEVVEFVLSKPDYTTAERLEQAINTEFGGEIAIARSSSTVAIQVPADDRERFARFAARVEALQVDVDAIARIVVDERTGTVVFGANVQVAPVAIAHGALTIEVRRLNTASQPAAFSTGSTAVVSNSVLEANEETGSLVVVEGVDIGELVAALNAMGVKPRDLISILKNMKTQGAIHADVVTQ